MNKSLAAVLFAISGGLGYFTGTAVNSPADIKANVTLVNAKFVRAQQRVVLPDGGTNDQAVWYVRACGYLMPADGGQEHVAEPCWDDFISAADFASIERQLLDGDAGR